MITQYPISPHFNTRQQHESVTVNVAVQECKKSLYNGTLERQTTLTINRQKKMPTLQQNKKSCNPRSRRHKLQHILFCLTLSDPPTTLTDFYLADSLVTGNEFLHLKLYL
jgi:hypothetical protein